MPTEYHSQVRNTASGPHRLMPIFHFAPGLWFLVLAFAVLSPQPARAQEQEPIAAAGHGGFFDQSGKQIPLTLDFATSAQAWYRNKLSAELSAAKKREFAAYEKRLLAGP